MDKLLSIIGDEGLSLDTILTAVLDEGLPMYSLVSMIVTVLVGIFLFLFGLYLSADDARDMKFLNNGYFINPKKSRYATYQVKLVVLVDIVAGLVIICEGVYKILNASIYGEVLVALGVIKILSSVISTVITLRMDEKRTRLEIDEVIVDTIYSNLKKHLKSKGTVDFKLKVEPTYQEYRGIEGKTIYTRLLAIDIYLEDTYYVDYVEQCIPDILSEVLKEAQKMVLTDSEKSMEVDLNVKVGVLNEQELEKQFSL